MNGKGQGISNGPDRPRWIWDFVATCAFAVALPLLFWQPLFQGQMFIGGDVYNYFLPLKHFYAEGLRQNEIRFWHPGIGNGVPVLGESQTGVFYPFYLAAYRFLGLVAAYNSVFLIHYVLAFLFTCWLARALGLDLPGSLFAGVVFVYGWFPPRACLEWAIVTGAWLPLILLGVTRWIGTGSWCWVWLIAGSTAVQLLAGHFQLAFITVLAVGFATVFLPRQTGSLLTDLRRRACVPVIVAAGFGLAAPQLLPTWELKARSQRATEEFSGTVSFGRVPPHYLIQWIAPWYVYPNADQLIADGGGDSNKVEAHLYIGLAPLALLVAMLIARRLPRRLLWVAALTLASLILALGWPFNWLANVPGFSFFRYPGRYGILTQLGAALLTAAASQSLFAERPRLRHVASCLLLALMIADFLWVSSVVQYVEARPPILDRMSQSEVFRHLTPTDRVLAMDGNTLSLSGAACVPPYLGMGPAEYYEIWGKMPDVFHGARATAEAIQVLSQMGVTYILTEQPLSADWPAELAWKGYDEFLNPRWGRTEPLNLYRFHGVGRAYLRTNGQPTESGGVEIEQLRHNRVALTTSASQAADLVLTDLAYPGWRVAVDGYPADAVAGELFRVVSLPPGEHTIVWTYTPDRFYLGCTAALVVLTALSIATFLLSKQRRQCGRGL